MSSMPEGFHTITPYIRVADGDAALDLYEKALGAEVLGKLENPSGRGVMHATLQIGDSKLFLSDMMPADAPGVGAASFYLYVPDVDAAHKRAVDAGLTELDAPADMFWGDRMSVVLDPDGHKWSFATHLRDVSADEMAEAMRQMPG